MESREVLKDRLESYLNILSTSEIKTYSQLQNVNNRIVNPIYKTLITIKENNFKINPNIYKFINGISLADLKSLNRDNCLIFNSMMTGIDRIRRTFHTNYNLHLNYDDIKVKKCKFRNKRCFKFTFKTKKLTPVEVSEILRKSESIISARLYNPKNNSIEAILLGDDELEIYINSEHIELVYKLMKIRNEEEYL